VNDAVCFPQQGGRVSKGTYGAVRSTPEFLNGAAMAENAYRDFEVLCERRVFGVGRCVIK
jgi:hypothetical protein